MISTLALVAPPEAACYPESASWKRSSFHRAALSVPWNSPGILSQFSRPDHRAGVGAGDRICIPELVQPKGGNVGG